MASRRAIAPGIEDKFIEEWHQKLHTNCAPDDIIIADAYIKFLQSGNIDDYWNHLKGNGLSWEYMCSIGGGKGSANSGLKGMTASPMHLPQLTDDIKHLKWTLMQVHGGADIDFMIFKAKGRPRRRDKWPAARNPVQPSRVVGSGQDHRGAVEAAGLYRDH